MNILIIRNQNFYIHLQKNYFYPLGSCPHEPKSVWCINMALEETNYDTRAALLYKNNSIELRLTNGKFKAWHGLKQCHAFEFQFSFISIACPSPSRRINVLNDFPLLFFIRAISFETNWHPSDFNWLYNFSASSTIKVVCQYQISSALVSAG